VTNEYSKLRFTPEFLATFGDRKLTASDRAQILRALALLDSNERHPSLRVHALSGQLEGLWSASASDSLRLTFERLPDAVKNMVRCTKHYDR
jgi:mRNA-degrading endonuclease YafQ of YafQ-DinJ toxin-antitoxin module